MFSGKPESKMTHVLYSAYSTVVHRSVLLTFSDQSAGRLHGAQVRGDYAGVLSHVLEVTLENL